MRAIVLSLVALLLCSDLGWSRGLRRGTSPDETVTRRKRIVKRPCPVKVTLRSTTARVCPGEEFVVSWESNDPTARVDIVGIGNNLPATGSQSVIILETRLYVARARGASCTSSDTSLLVTVPKNAAAELSGPSDVAPGSVGTFTAIVTEVESWTVTSLLGNRIERTETAPGTFRLDYHAEREGNDVITLRAERRCGDPITRSLDLLVGITPPTISLAVPSTLTQGSTGTIVVNASKISSWTLTSGNPVSQRTGGNGTFSITYSATSTGVDAVTLTATTSDGSTLTRTASITVNPSTSGGILCCDGTRSPSCFDCGDIRGCCSSHGGVCGCPKAETDPGSDEE